MARDLLTATPIPWVSWWEVKEAKRRATQEKLDLWVITLKVV